MLVFLMNCRRVSPRIKLGWSECMIRFGFKAFYPRLTRKFCAEGFLVLFLQQPNIIPILITLKDQSNALLPQIDQVCLSFYADFATL